MSVGLCVWGSAVCSRLPQGLGRKKCDFLHKKTTIPFILQCSRPIVTRSYGHRMRYKVGKADWCESGTGPEGTNERGFGWGKFSNFRGAEAESVLRRRGPRHQMHWTEIGTQKGANLGQKCVRMRLAAGLHPNPLGELERSPDPLAAIGGAYF